MTDGDKFQALLASTGLTAWASVVPEGADLPALAWVHINGRPSRGLKGSTSGWQDSWRITVVAGNAADRSSALDALQQLDGTRQGGYHRILRTAQRLDTHSTGESVRRAYVDLTTVEGL